MLECLVLDMREPVAVNPGADGILEALEQMPQRPNQVFKSGQDRTFHTQ
jgi:hypothetical protein